MAANLSKESCSHWGLSHISCIIVVNLSAHSHSLCFYFVDMAREKGLCRSILQYKTETELSSAQVMKQYPVHYSSNTSKRTKEETISIHLSEEEEIRINSMANHPTEPRWVTTESERRSYSWWGQPLQDVPVTVLKLLTERAWKNT